MDDAGNSIVIWSGMRAEGYSDRVYKRQFRADRTAIDPKEVPVDGAPAYLKQQASVAMSNDGTCIAVSWTSFAQDEATADPPAKSDGVYAHMFYNPDPSNPASKWGEYQVNANPLGDFRLNANVAGNQNDSAVAMGPGGDMTAVWVGPNPNDPTSGLDIWARSVAVNGPGSTAANVYNPLANLALAAAVSSGESSQATLTDSALSDGDNAYADLTALLFPAPQLGPVVSGPANVTGSGDSVANLYDSALSDLLSTEGDQSQLTNLDATFGLPTSSLGTVNV
jgi:hypothetical protein